MIEITEPNHHQLISRAAHIAGANSGYLLANKRRNCCWPGTSTASIDLISGEDQDKSEKGREFVLLCSICCLYPPNIFTGFLVCFCWRVFSRGGVGQGLG